MPAGPTHQDPLLLASNSRVLSSRPPQRNRRRPGRRSRSSKRSRNGRWLQHTACLATRPLLLAGLLPAAHRTTAAQRQHLSRMQAVRPPSSLAPTFCHLPAWPALRQVPAAMPAGPALTEAGRQLCVMPSQQHPPFWHSSRHMPQQHMQQQTAAARAVPVQLVVRLQMGSLSCWLHAGICTQVPRPGLEVEERPEVTQASRQSLKPSSQSFWHRCCPALQTPAQALCQELGDQRVRQVLRLWQGQGRAAGQSVAPVAACCKEPCQLHRALQRHVQGGCCSSKGCCKRAGAAAAAATRCALPKLYSCRQSLTAHHQVVCTGQGQAAAAAASWAHNPPSKLQQPRRTALAGEKLVPQAACGLRQQVPQVSPLRHCQQQLHTPSSTKCFVSKTLGLSHTRPQAEQLQLPACCHTPQHSCLGSLLV